MYRVPKLIKIKDNGQITFRRNRLSENDYDAILIKENGKFYLCHVVYDENDRFRLDAKYLIQKYPVQNNIYIQFESDICAIYKPVK